MYIEREVTSMNEHIPALKEYTFTNGVYNVRYILIEERILDEDGYRPSFSLTVKRGAESATLADFTTSREIALPLVDLFCREAVFPEELADLAEELLSDLEFVE